MKIGIWPLLEVAQDDFFRSKECCFEPLNIKHVNDLNKIQGLIISEGRSFSEEFKEKVLDRINEGLSVWSLGSGVYSVCKEGVGELKTLALMDITLRPSNQKKLGRVVIDIPALGEPPFQVDLAGSPVIIKVKPNVGILSLYEERIIMVRQGNFLATTFNLINPLDFRIHRYFTKMVKDAINIR